MERLFSRFGKNKLLNYLILGRFWNAIVAGFFSVIGAKIAIGFVPDVFSIFILLFVTTLVYMGSAGLNDIFDIKSDSINMPFRPLESNLINLKEAGIFTTICFTAALFISAIASPLYLISIVIMTLLGIMYSLPPISLKNRDMLANVSLGFITVFTTGYSGIVLLTNNLLMSTASISILVFISLFFSFFSVLKDFKDVTGDRFTKKKTLPINHGFRTASIINMSGTLIFYLISVVLIYILVIPNVIFLMASLVILLLIFVQEYKVFRIQTKKAGEDSWSVARILVLAFVILTLLF